MTTMLDPVSPTLLASILGRTESLFAPDLDVARDRLADAIRGRRVLVTGGAGSIGSAFIQQLLPFRPGALLVVDLSENSLAELVRDLRASSLPLPERFSTYAIAFGSLEFEHVFADAGPFDYLVNFAALKHVRSERDPYSLMRMIDTNVLALDRFLQAAASGVPPGVFSVSSDKAIRPANLMGATKAWMEKILWRHSAGRVCSTARFANVAFSDGSLPFAFRQRIAKRQPLSAPSDVKRYFISHEEAGQLCLLACFLSASRTIVIPRLDARHAASLVDVAVQLLDSLGMEPWPCDSEEEAKARAAQLPAQPRRWPCYFSPSDTTGEKTLEEFCAEEEAPDYSAYRALGVIRHRGEVDERSLQAARDAIDRIRDSRLWRKTDILAAVRLAVPDLIHVEHGRSLDEKM